MAESAGENRGPRLVPESVTTAKFNEQLERWHANEVIHRQRGCLLLSVGDLSVDLGIVKNVPAGDRTLTVMTVCVRVDFWNFDMWPPSVTFLDPLTRQPGPPPVRALDVTPTGELRDVLIDQHPETQQAFVCLPGIREYHTHPQHTGDDWFLHRQRREGDLVVICERLWRRMARNVMGMSIGVHSMATPNPGLINNQVQVVLGQGDADLLEHAARAAASPGVDVGLDAAADDSATIAHAVPPEPPAHSTGGGN